MGPCKLLCKAVIMIFNLLYLVVGLAFLVVGLWLRLGNNTRGLSDSSLVTGEYVLIAVAAVMLLTVAIGEHGGCSDKTSSLASFCVLLVLLIAAQIALYAQQHNVGPRLSEFYVILYVVYIASGDPVVGVTLRVMHYTLDCCGAVGIVGLDLSSHTCPQKSGFLDRFMAPCPLRLQDVFSDKPPVAMAFFWGNAVLLVAALVSAGSLLGLQKRPAGYNHPELLLSTVHNPSPNAYLAPPPHCPQPLPYQLLSSSSPQSTTPPPPSTELLLSTVHNPSSTVY